MHNLVNSLKLILLVCAVLILLGDVLFSGHRRARRLITGFLSVLAIVGIFAYGNFGNFHAPYGYVHTWEMFHYHLSAKYADELGFDGLYGAALVADAEDRNPWFGSIAQARDLRSAELVDRSELLADSSYKDAFSERAWANFRADLAAMKYRYPPHVWVRVLQDHGYNAPPSRTTLHRWLVKAFGPATDSSLLLMALLDPLLLLILLIAVWWCMGTRAAAIATLIFGLNMLSPWYWNGGSLRKSPPRPSPRNRGDVSLRFRLSAPDGYAIR